MVWGIKWVETGEWFGYGYHSRLEAAQAFLYWENGSCVTKGSVVFINFDLTENN